MGFLKGIINCQIVKAEGFQEWGGRFQELRL
jgi:hypothetical protein